MKIIVLSDTHMPKKSKQLPPIVIDHLRQSNFIFHLGDWQSVDLYEELMIYGPVEGVAGNVDDEKIIQKLGYRKIVKIKGYSFGLIHGHDGKGRTTEERAIHAFQNEHVDVILFGHSHIPLFKQHEPFILFNPGSPTDKRRQKRYSIGMITIDETLHFEHLFFDNR